MSIVKLVRTRQLACHEIFPLSVKDRRQVFKTLEWLRPLLCLEEVAELDRERHVAVPGLALGAEI